jgi:hypothetical protein
MSSLHSEEYTKAELMSKEANAFRAAGLWPIDLNEYSGNDLFPVEISTHLMTSLMKKHVAAVNRRMEQISCRMYKAVHSSRSHHNVSTGGSTSTKRRVPIDNISSLPKHTADYEKRKKMALTKLFFSLGAQTRFTASLQKRSKRAKN